MVSRVIAISGGKGGVGKSTTTINLGVSLRMDGYSVVIVDADVEMPNLMEMLNVEAYTTIHDVLSGDADPSDAIVEVGKGFAAVPGDPELAGYGNIEPERLHTVIDTLSAKYDFVLLDSGAGLSYDDVLPLAIADEIILVTSPDQAAVDNAKRTQAFVRRLNREVTGIVVSKANPVFTDTVDEQFDADVLGVIPKDEVVAQSTANGQPLELFAPESAAAEAYRRLEANLTNGRLPPARTVEDEPEDETRSADDEKDDETDEAAESANEERVAEPDRPRRERPEPGIVSRITSIFG